MTEEEEQIAFQQWCKDWGNNFKGMSKSALWQIYRSMDLENRKEFLERKQGDRKMKDEEMAEEYAKKECKNCSYRCDKPNVFKRLSNKKECHAYFRSYEGYLAGLKAGRPQWHDLREDPNDLPNMNAKVLFYCYGRVKQGLFTGIFKSYYGDCKVEEVIAWCEIPTFDKE